MQGILATTNPAYQIVAWIVELFNSIVANWETVSVTLAAGLGLYLGMTLIERFQSDAAPSLRYSSSSGAGSTSIVISGVHVTLLLTGGIAFLMWPMPVEVPAVGMGLVGMVVAHFYLEKQEVSG